MRRSASEIIRNLENRIARLERKAPAPRNSRKASRGSAFRSRSARVLDTEDLIKEISDLTEWNAHTDAVVLLAEHYGDRSDQDDANYVKTVHEAQGHMPRDVSDFRYKLLKKLLSKAKRVLSVGQYQELYLAF
jgi:hypothetical protein